MELRPEQLEGVPGEPLARVPREPFGDRCGVPWGRRLAQESVERRREGPGVAGRDDDAGLERADEFGALAAFPEHQDGPSGRQVLVELAGDVSSEARPVEEEEGSAGSHEAVGGGTGQVVNELDDLGMGECPDGPERAG